MMQLANGDLSAIVPDSLKGIVRGIQGKSQQPSFLDMASSFMGGSSGGNSDSGILGGMGNLIGGSSSGGNFLSNLMGGGSQQSSSSGILGGLFGGGSQQNQNSGFLDGLFGGGSSQPQPQQSSGFSLSNLFSHHQKLRHTQP
jgi:hypothetical protein